MLLSLRGVICALSALFVAIVAAVTLGITLTSSLSALRTIGKSHASALLKNANLETEALFNTPVKALESIKNFTLTEPWKNPSDDNYTYTCYATLHRTLYYEMGADSGGLYTYFFDNTRYGVERVYSAPYAYAMTNFIPAPYSIGGMAYQGTQPIRTDLRAWYVDNNTVVPRSDPAYELPEATVLVRNTSTWALFQTFSLGFFKGVIAGVFLVLRDGIVPVHYVPMGIPLYLAGTPKGPSTVFGFSLASLYSDEIGRFLQGIGTPNTAAFAVGGDGFLIGTSMQQKAPYARVFLDDPAAPFKSKPGCASTAATSGLTGTLNTKTYISCRSSASDYPFAPLQALAGDAELLFFKGSVVTMIDVGGDMWYAATSQVYMLYPGMDVHLVLLLPEADVIGDVVSGRNTAIGVTVAVFVVVAALSFALISVLLAPLTTVSERMMRAALLEDEDTSREVSAMAEVRELQEAYYAMNDELNRIKSFVPQSVFEQRRAAADDGDDVDAEAEALAAEKHRGRLDESTSQAGSKRTVTQSERTRKSESSSQRSSSLAIVGAAITATSLAPTMVTVVAGNLRGFGARVHEAHGTSSVVSAVSEVVGLVVTTARAHAGVVQSFHGDHFVLTFNAARPCPAHARHGALAALQLAQASTQCGFRLLLQAGIATGRCLVGNLGSQDLKSFNTIGASFTHALILERLSRLYGADCRVLATRRTCAELTAQVPYCFVDIVELPQTEKPTIVGALLQPPPEGHGAGGQRPDAAVGGGGGEGHANEWLYIVGRTGALEKHNETFAALMDAKLTTFAETLGDVEGPSGAGGLRHAYDALLRQRLERTPGTVPSTPLGRFYADAVRGGGRGRII